MAPHIHITGASGCGVTTLGRALAIQLGGIALDIDDFYWIPTHPPYQYKRPVEERLRLLNDAIPADLPWVISGACDSWASPLIPRFDLVVFLRVPTEVRLARLRHRERSRFGDEAVAPGGYFHQNHAEFIEWASHYESGDLPGRSLPRHEAWLRTLHCPVLRLVGDQPVAALTSAVMEHLRKLSDWAPDTRQTYLSTFAPEYRQQILNAMESREGAHSPIEPEHAGEQAQ